MVLNKVQELLLTNMLDKRLEELEELLVYYNKEKLDTKALVNELTELKEIKNKLEK